MTTELDSIKRELETLKTQMILTEQKQLHATRRARLLGGLAFTLVAGTLALSSLKPVGAQGGGYGPTLTQLAARMTTVETKTQFMYADGGTRSTTFSGCNVYVQNGLGATNGKPGNTYDTVNPVVNGVGNLIIGYNSPGGRDDSRPGSHNLILGDRNSYSSYGGLVAGSDNTIFGPYASVSGGQGNTASVNWASVSGGSNNAANEFFASVSGGNFNTASGNSASVSGGYGGKATSPSASVSGGQYNLASNPYASVAGGYGNGATGTYASVLGGYGNNASGTYSIVCGGSFCGATGYYSANLGGFGTSVSAQYGHNP